MLAPGDGVLKSRLLEPDGLDPLWFGSLFLPSDLDGKRGKSGSGWTTVSTLCRCLCMGRRYGKPAGLEGLEGGGVVDKSISTCL